MTLKSWSLEAMFASPIVTTPRLAVYAQGKLTPKKALAMRLERMEHPELLAKGLDVFLKGEDALPLAQARQLEDQLVKAKMGLNKHLDVTAAEEALQQAKTPLEAIKDTVLKQLKLLEETGIRFTAPTKLDQGNFYSRVTPKGFWGKFKMLFSKRPAHLELYDPNGAGKFYVIGEKAVLLQEAHQLTKVADRTLKLVPEQTVATTGKAGVQNVLQSVAKRMAEERLGVPARVVEDSFPEVIPQQFKAVVEDNRTLTSLTRKSAARKMVADGLKEVFALVKQFTAPITSPELRASVVKVLAHLV